MRSLLRTVLFSFSLLPFALMPFFGSNLLAASPSAMSAPASTGGTAPAPIAPQGPPSPPTSSQLYRIVGCRSSGDIMHFSGPSRREVAIGFDDGPWPDTPAFVQMLEREHVPATFFMIGEQVSTSYRTTLLRELKDGDALGNHTYTHPDLTKTGDAYSQLARTNQAIKAVTGYTPCVFRPPYGSFNQTVIDTARSLGLASVYWNDDPTDWALPGTSAIVQSVLSQVRPGSIIISHDGGGPRAETLAAYPAIISGLHSRGYSIITIPQLLGFRPIYVPCIRLCDGIGVLRSSLPHGAIITQAP